MLHELIRFLPPEGIKILLVLFLSFLIGLEREEHKSGGEKYVFGGVRTFPLIGLLGYAMAFLSGPQLLPLIVGFAVVGTFLLLSYQHKLQTSQVAGVTTEISGLATYIVGALVAREQFWIATTLAVVGVLLLELKVVLENLSRRVPSEEIFTFSKFLLLTAVILPVLPNQAFGPFQFNPFQAWLVVMAVSAISYASYLLQVVTKGHGGVRISAVLGGAYSSTLATVVLAKRAREEERPHMFAGGILMASGVMYARLLALVAMFSRELTRALVLPFLVLAGTGLLIGWVWSRRADANAKPLERRFAPQNPLELRAALLFAVLFVAMLALTHYAIIFLGSGGVYGLASIIGVTDVVPFVMGLTQSAGRITPPGVAAAGIVIAAASNNVIKGVYAYGFSDRKTGRESLGLLLGFSALSLLPLFLLSF